MMLIIERDSSSQKLDSITQVESSSGLTINSNDGFEFKTFDSATQLGVMSWC